RRLYRAWRKTVIHRGRPRADRPDDCQEAFGWRYAWMVLSFGGWTAPLAARLEAAAAGPVLRLSGDAEARRLVDEVARSHGDGR
ncbi:MAG TPA: hypothetical protein VN806_12810, partial [Caulobacteraceae bacterium]|nr:hypothetical protein [Caulobacteraceae bacterium]